MTKHDCFSLVLIFTIFLITVSCDKEKSPDDQPVNPADSGRYIVTYNESQLAGNLNGYRFESAFGTAEPLAYPYLWLQFADDYNDSIRLVVLNQNAAKSITRYMTANCYNGNISRKFDHGTFPNDVSNSMSFAFDHPKFLLFWYDKVNGTITQTATVFGMNAQVSQIFTGMQDQYSYQFLNRYLIRYISGISLWPFNHANWNDETQFVATSELSAPKAIGHYFDETFSTFPYDVLHNMYSGFFQSTYAGTYVGISKGSTNLDTLMLNNNPPEWYDPQICSAFIDKSGDTLYLGTTVNVPNTIQVVSSLYRLIEGSGRMEVVYSDIPVVHQLRFFRHGYYYGTSSTDGKPVRINRSGVAESVPVPETSTGASLIYSSNKIIALSVSPDGKRLEVFSRDY
ncbi:MAG: hypothetical protein IPH20_04855 [Bacteroidales bacterium]|nr:hypothetical protein [Bacteroidales bacterium]